MEQGLLGEKTGGGFYSKEGKEIRTLDWKTLEYRERRKPRSPSLDAAQAVADPVERVRKLLAGTDKGGQFLWRVLAGDLPLRGLARARDARTTCGRWTGPWSGATAGPLGPFRSLDALGVAALAERVEGRGRPVPAFLRGAARLGPRALLRGRTARRQGVRPDGVAPVPDAGRASSTWPR